MRGSRRRLAVAALLAAVAFLAAACGGSSTKHPPSSTDPTTPPPSTTAPATSAPPSSTPPPKPTAAQLKAQVTAAIGRLTAKQPKHAVSVAALNTVTGAHYQYGDTSGHWTASVYKLFILEVLLQQQGGPLTGGAASSAIPAIEQSNNVAGYQLFLDAGGRPGLVSGAKELGLKHTVPGQTDPTFTETGAPDLLILLRNLVGPGPLTTSARAYALHLMRSVESDQRWGVGVIADKGTDFANKNGWLSIGPGNATGENDGGLWAVNSVGVLTVHGQQVLVAVMTQHQPDLQTGINLVQALTRALRPAIAP